MITLPSAIIVLVATFLPLIVGYQMGYNNASKVESVTECDECL